eukprot:CAMPEP_0194542498 /NCGR_PEP_ID=MMETSP0253-20130528/84114_1 /TAXON_ID=2966 /ORGANISM="Noctiluca scintillans" /LENGTH=704 /DNA_ID=CAMNT_0039389123 /DNA_START=77 /DNA_END=2191 /DNA_ORIENTATION=-
MRSSSVSSVTLNWTPSAMYQRSLQGSSSRNSLSPAHSSSPLRSHVPYLHRVARDSSPAAKISSSLATERVVHRVHQLHENVGEATRAAEDTRELRRLVERADASTHDFRLHLEAEAAHQHSIVETERELRGKEFAETHAALAVTRGRLSVLEGTVGVHTNQLKELGNLEDRVQTQHHRLGALERALSSAEADRRSAFELLESRVKDEHSIIGTALEVKTQEVLRMMMLGLEQMEIKFREEFSDTVGRVENMCQDVSRNLEDKDCAQRSVIQSLGESHSRLEERMRDEKNDNDSKHLDAQGALESAIFPLRAQLNDVSRELVAKHRDHENQFQTMTSTFERNLADEINRTSREGDAKLQETANALDTQISEHLDRLARDNAAEHQQHSVRLGDAIDTLERKIWEDLNQFSKENDKLDQKHREEVQRLEKDIDAKCDRIHRDLTLGLNDREKDLRTTILGVSDAINSEYRTLKMQHAALSSSLDELDQRSRDAQAENLAKHIEARDAIQLGVQFNKDLEQMEMAKYNDVQSSLATAHWNAQKFKDDIARQAGDILATSNKVSSLACKVNALDEKHQVCDDFNQARGVLESLMAKVEAFPVDLRRETIRLSDAAEKKHGELRDVQRSEMVRLREEIARLVLEMNGQNDVALQHITASVEDRSREVADLATAVHSLEMHLSSTPIHTPLISARRPYALSSVTTTSYRP